jgi:hypothetical protein
MGESRKFGNGNGKEKVKFNYQKDTNHMGNIRIPVYSRLAKRQSRKIFVKSS